jgi:hypothetical protein
MCGRVRQTAQVIRDVEWHVACHWTPDSEFDESKENGLPSVARAVCRERKTRIRKFIKYSLL